MLFQVDQTLFRTQLQSEFEELRQLYNEAVKNTNALEAEIAQMKHDHESQVRKIDRKLSRSKTIWEI